MSALLRVLQAQVRVGNDAPAQRFLVQGEWRHRSYADLHGLVSRVAAGLLARGIRPADRVAIIMPTRADWTVVDLAVASIGATVVPIYPTSSTQQMGDLIARSSARLVVADAGRDLPDLTDGAVVLLRAGTEDGDLGELVTHGATEGAELSETAAVDSDLFTIGFSSGTTGTPKGCLLTHANYAAVIRSALEFELAGRPPPAHRQAAFVYLPLAHASARLHQLLTLATGGELVYGTGSSTEVLRQIGESRPTYAAGVPRLFESAWIAADGDPETLRRMFGGNLVYVLTGGAPIAPELLDAYDRAGIRLVEGYGLTETSTALTLSAPHDVRVGSVGRALGGVDLRIAEDGEILARGANVFVGYLDDAAATKQAFVDEWFRTGDLGRLDADGYLYVTGRSKNLIVTSTGKNIAPEPLENAIRARSQVTDVVVVGDRRPYLCALVVAPSDRHAAVTEAVRTINVEVSPPERVKKLVMLDRPFADIPGLVTASGKTVRPAAIEHWRDVLDAVYGSGPEQAVVIDVDRPPRLLAAG